MDDVLAEPSPYVTCAWTKKACERQRSDLLRQGQEDFPYVWDPEAGSDVIEFISCLKHLKGEHAGKPFILSPWQVFFVMVLFSWKRSDDTRLRRYRRFILQCGKSSGKTATSAALCLHMLCNDNEGGAEIATAARATTQARLTFDTARDMLRAAPKLCAEFGLRVLQHSIVQQKSASVMLPVSAQGKSLAGKILHYGSVDECWSHRSREVYEEIALGCDKRNNSILASIGHAGESILSVGYELYASATKILDGDLKDERTFALIYDGSGYDWKVGDDAILAANPNAGVSSYLDTIREARDRALAIPALQPAYLSHMLCMWSDGEELKKWLAPALLTPCRSASKIEDFRLWHVGEHPSVIQPDMLRPFVVGIHRSSLQERAAVVYCCKSYLDGVEHFNLFPQYFDPESNSDEQLCDAVLGSFRNHLGYGVTLNSETGYKIKALAHDAYFPPSARFEKNGINTLEFHKTAKTFSPVMDRFYALALARTVHFPKEDETLFSHLLGIQCIRDLNSNIFPRRANPEKSIDAALATFFALRLAMTDMLAPPERSDCTVTFIDEDGTVKQSDKDGKLVTVFGPLSDQERFGAA
jgi:phage terminase large subunit-like protein